MCSKDQFNSLTKTEDCQITYCKACRNFSLTFKCCCGSFSLKELQGFCETLESLTDCDFEYNDNDQPKVVVKSPAEKIGFCLSQTEAKELALSIGESLSLFEVFQIIYT